MPGYTNPYSRSLFQNRRLITYHMFECSCVYIGSWMCAFELWDWACNCEMSISHIFLIWSPTYVLWYSLSLSSYVTNFIELLSYSGVVDRQFHGDLFLFICMQIQVVWTEVFLLPWMQILDCHLLSLKQLHIRSNHLTNWSTGQQKKDF